MPSSPLSPRFLPGTLRSSPCVTSRASRRPKQPSNSGSAPGISGFGSTAHGSGCEHCSVPARTTRAVAKPWSHYAGTFPYLLSSADPTARQLSTRWAERLRAEDARRHGLLARTFAVYVACNLNVIQAANQLGLHPNTIRSRLAKVERLAGLDARRVIDVMELVTVMKLSSAAEAGNRKK